MTSPSLLVTDTNIWIDLEHGGLLAQVFELPYQFCVPDFAVPELARPGWRSLQALGLRALELEPALVGELLLLRAAHRALSVTDLSAFLLARTLNITLLTGDARLNDLASRGGVRVHGVLWLLDELVRYEAVAPAEAAGALEQMLSQGARLPPDECRKRLSTWTLDEVTVLAVAGRCWA